jgi:dihydrolipoamide dehydrogenase
MQWQSGLDRNIGDATVSDNFDVIVIGGGPAGYVAAIRASQNGLKTACIDGWKNYDGSYAFGGTCLNAGCIPSKALLESSELYHRTHDEFARHGIQLEGVSLDLDTMMKRKAGITRQLTSGIEALFKSNGVTGLQGHGRFLGNGQVEFTPHDGEAQALATKTVVLASGSAPVELKQVPFDGESIVDSWGSLEFDAVPKRLGIIGAGVIGLELGSVWRRLGAEVTVLEAMPDFLAMADRAVAREAQRHFKKLGLDIKLGAKVQGAEKTASGIKLSYQAGEATQSIEVDKVVVAVGRRPYTEELFGPDAGVRQDDRGFIVVDDQCRTNVPNVWAVGDCVRGPMLAHKASEEGVMVADLISGQYGHVNYKTIPSVIYTAPEIAWVGRTEEQVREAGINYKTGSFSFAANGRAKALEQAVGFVKIVSSAADDEILGVHIVGPMAGELIAEAVLAMEFSASTEDIQRTIHGHPSLSEVMHEASLAVDKRALHGINKT